MKKYLMITLMIILVLILGACSNQEIVTVVVTATSQPTPTPWPTPRPSITPARIQRPTEVSVSISDIEIALHDAGFTREPYIDTGGYPGMLWKKGVWNADFVIWDNDEITIRTLLDIGDPEITMTAMEKAFLPLDSVFSSDVMSELRENSKAYLDNNHRISGKPFSSDARGGEWQEVYARFNKEVSAFGPYGVTFSLDFWQVTCPPQADLCNFQYFPGTFTDQASFTYFRIDFRP